MRIGIIGAGAIGLALAGGLKRRGHEIGIANSRGPHTLTKFAAELAVKPVTVGEAVVAVDVVVLSIPLGRIRSLPHDLFDAVRPDVAIVDAANYYPGRDGAIDEIEQGMPESAWVAAQIGRPVVKAFNSIGALRLANSGTQASESRIALPVAGDCDKAKDIVRTLVGDMGFDFVDAGSLQDSWRQQPGSPVYCTDLDAGAVSAGLARAIRHLLSIRRDEALRRKQRLSIDTADEEWLWLKREIYA